jgi:hypothetical protein
MDGRIDVVACTPFLVRNDYNLKAKFTLLKVLATFVTFEKYLWLQNILVEKETHVHQN